ncbi:type IV inositol polyphosphate 5-phosphatase 7-like isoform X1 [Zingiber officinale]|uniref:type IV inositol polyphosphate 5-phosphatase 7-like isoform X1 n=1 Tax=Zingiber officinale TaxID=94328 RepID=UPI001C4BB0F1|nr:type IV inositol polyphosphate 5-phosphatase 7-like isoform X1 [Zingiber officinale]
MRDYDSKKSKLSWSKAFVKKWFSIKSKGQESHVDEIDGKGSSQWKADISEREACILKKSRTDRVLQEIDQVQKGNFDPHSAQITDIQDYKIFAATWNVGGRSPPKNLNLLDWIHASSPADIYVLGFQEIVPLNAGNVLGSEDDGPAKKWLWLIRKALNSPDTCGSDSFHTPSPVPDPILELNADFERSSARQKNSAFLHRRSFHSLSRSMRMEGDTMFPHPVLDHRFSVCERVSVGSRPSDFDPSPRGEGPEGSSDGENIGEESPSELFVSPFYGYGAPPDPEERYRLSANSGLRYCLVASKQMVGIFLTIWVRNDIRDDVRELKVSCVGRGLMGYLGNKEYFLQGSISISMSLHQTSFCFICSHLTSGQKEGDELRRNSDVMEILKKTRFPKVQRGDNEKSLETIFDHDRVIWLGDLNYRIALSYRSVKALVEMRNWRALLEKDQLLIEQRCGRVFKGWKEGRIYFPPTYKYSNNSDRYAGDETNPKKKQRTPAWCDRVLWFGRGLNQLAYVRGESRFSDHRPVFSIFTAEVEMNNYSCSKNMGYCSSRVELEELLAYSQGYRGVN